MMSGSVGQIPRLPVAVTVGLLREFRRAEPGQNGLAACSARPELASFSVTQVVVEAVGHVEVVCEQESCGSEEEGRTWGIEHSAEHHGRLNRGRQEAGSAHRVASERK